MAAALSFLTLALRSAPGADVEVGGLEFQRRAFDLDLLAEPALGPAADPQPFWREHRGKGRRGSDQGLGQIARGGCLGARRRLDATSDDDTFVQLAPGERQGAPDA